MTAAGQEETVVELGLTVSKSAIAAGGVASAGMTGVAQVADVEALTA